MKKMTRALHGTGRFFKTLLSDNKHSEVHIYQL